MANHRFSQPVPYTPDTEFDHAVHFAVDKRDAALVPVIGRISGSHVRTVTDVPSDWEMVAEQAAVQFLGNVPNVGLPARAALIRSALRGQGRARHR